MARGAVSSLKWHHDGRDRVSNHYPRNCLLNRLFRRRSKKTSKLRVTGLCVGIHQWPVNSPHQGLVTRKLFPFDDVIMVIWHIQMKQIFLRIPNEKILHLEARLPRHFVLTLKLLSSDRSQGLCDVISELFNAHKIFIDSQYNDGFAGSSRKIFGWIMIHSSTVYCVYSNSDTANCLFAHSTKRESCIKVTILVCGMCEAIFSKPKCHIPVFPLCFPNVPFLFPVVYIRYRGNIEWFWSVLIFTLVIELYHSVYP